jgi:hypothetical protein
MSQDPTTTTPETSSTPTAPAPQSAAPAITPEIQALIDAARVEGRNSGAAETRRALEAKIKPHPSAAAPQPAAPATPPPAASPPEYQAMRSFDRAMRRFDLSDEALAVVEEDFARANPSDPTAWVTARASAYGWKQLGATTMTPPVQPPAAPQASANPVTGNGAPSNPAHVVTGDVPIYRMSVADRSATLARLGPAKYVERMQAELRRDQVRVALK